MNSGDLVFVAPEYFFPLYDLSGGGFKRFTDGDHIIVIAINADTLTPVLRTVTVLCHDGIYKVSLSHLLRLNSER